MITNFKPLLVMAGFPCTDYCVFNVRFNYHDRPEALHAKWKANLPMLRNTMNNLRRQHEEGRLFLLENPPSSRLWDQEPVRILASLPGVISSIGHQCQYGLVDGDGIPIRKPMKWLTNDP